MAAPGRSTAVTLVEPGRRVGLYQAQSIRRSTLVDTSKAGPVRAGRPVSWENAATSSAQADSPPWGRPLGDLHAERPRSKHYRSMERVGSAASEARVFLAGLQEQAAEPAVIRSGQ